MSTAASIASKCTTKNPKLLKPRYHTSLWRWLSSIMHRRYSASSTSDNPTEGSPLQRVRARSQSTASTKTTMVSAPLSSRTKSTASSSPASTKTTMVSTPLSSKAKSAASSSKYSANSSAALRSAVGDDKDKLTNEEIRRLCIEDERLLHGAATWSVTSIHNMTSALSSHESVTSSSQKGPKFLFWKRSPSESSMSADPARSTHQASIKPTPQHPTIPDITAFMAHMALNHKALGPRISREPTEVSMQELGDQYMPLPQNFDLYRRAPSVTSSSWDGSGRPSTMWRGKTLSTASPVWEDRQYYPSPWAGRATSVATWESSDEGTDAIITPDFMRKIADVNRKRRPSYVHLPEHKHQHVRPESRARSFRDVDPGSLRWSQN
ncbi:hypothetical protein BDW02DRAFT_429709 [Decorospora gaudefroyi]|uniref:Uncharacterized protein n=1 Tax=Decorospora gaudefroyi TaxID=184978 RepID=A0A6A5K576_9PLEO|nr:hypothetical protein BDW02DRAFT_429709 [Decorospora gaudefroyi]